MIRRLSYLAAALGIIAVVLAAPIPAVHAAMPSQLLCAPPSPSGLPGPGRVTNPNTSGGTYTLNRRGCAQIAAADVGYFLSQGYVQDAAYFALQLTGITASPATLVVPPGGYINAIIVRETSGAAVTGGIKIGTTSGATDVVSALTCGSLCYTYVLDSALSKRVFSATVAQTIFIDAVTSFNNSSLSVTVFYSLP